MLFGENSPNPPTDKRPERLPMQTILPHRTAHRRVEGHAPTLHAWHGMVFHKHAARNNTDRRSGNTIGNGIPAL